MRAPGIFPDHIGRLKTGMGYIATPATAHPYFVQHAVPFLGNDNFQRGMQPCRIDRAKKTGSAAAYNDQSL